MPNGLNPTGFQRKRLDEIKSDMESDFKLVFGNNLNTSAESPDGQIIGVTSGSFSDLWEIAEGAYNAFNPSAATGATLSSLVQLNGITRIPASSSKVVLTVTGNNGTVIPAGSIVSSQDNLVSFSTDISVTIPVSGTITINASSTTTGPIPAVANTLTKIDNPVTGWNTVTNSQDAVLGSDEESDPELRARRERSVSRPAKGILETILAEVLSVSAVKEAFIYNNDTLTTDTSTNTPGKAFQVVVLGGVDADIAKVIFDEKPVGIQAFGTTLIPVLDSQGISHNIGITRPASIVIFIIVNITVDPSYPSNGATTIKQNIVDYANGDLVQNRGFGVGDDIIQTELYTPINMVIGHSINSVFIGTSSNPTQESNIVINFDQISNFDIINIVVNEI